eukprot:1082764_1
MILRPTRSILFHYTTLFRSVFVIQLVTAKKLYGFTYPFLLVDFLIGVVICVMFARKLWLLQHQLDQSHRTDIDKNIDFIPAAKKQTKLVFVAYITSLLAMY